jgi:hypothetical protein
MILPDLTRVATDNASPLLSGLTRRRIKVYGEDLTGVAPLRTLASLAILLLITNAQCAEAYSAQVVKSTPTLVIVPTSVRSQYGELIRDLDADQFRLEDNGQDQNVYLEHVENEPLAVSAPPV